MRLLLLVCVAIVLSACVSIATLDPIKAEGQTTEFNPGEVIIYSPGSSVVVAVGADQPYEVGSRIKFAVVVINRGERPFDVSPSDITVYGNGVQLAQVSLAQLTKEAHNASVWESIGAGLAGAASQYSAAESGTTYHSGTSTAYVRDSSGRSAVVSGTYTGTTYDAGEVARKQQLAAAQTDREMAAIQAEKQEKIAGLRSEVFQRTTLQKDDGAGGFVYVAAPSPRNQSNLFEIDVAVAGEVHHFKFREGIAAQ